MAQIKLITEKNASPEIRGIYEEIKTTMGWSFIPETFQLIAHNPDHLKTYWSHYKETIAAGNLDPRIKEIIAYTVSVVNKCDACIRFHLDSLYQLGLDDKDLAELVGVISDAAKSNILMHGIGRRH